jgi:hypothetical protein
MLLQWFNWALIAFGIGFTIDGLGSAWLRNGQYHNVWFDGERYVRATCGIVIIILGIIIH